MPRIILIGGTLDNVVDVVELGLFVDSSVTLVVDGVPGEQGVLIRGAAVVAEPHRRDLRRGLGREDVEGVPTRRVGHRGHVAIGLQPVVVDLGALRGDDEARGLCDARVQLETHQIAPQHAALGTQTRGIRVDDGDRQSRRVARPRRDQDSGVAVVARRVRYARDQDALEGHTVQHRPPEVRRIVVRDRIGRIDGHESIATRGFFVPEGIARLRAEPIRAVRRRKRNEVEGPVRPVRAALGGQEEHVGVELPGAAEHVAIIEGDLDVLDRGVDHVHRDSAKAARDRGADALQHLAEVRARGRVVVGAPRDLGNFLERVGHRPPAEGDGIDHDAPGRGLRGLVTRRPGGAVGDHDRPLDRVDPVRIEQVIGRLHGRAEVRPALTRQRVDRRVQHRLVSRESLHDPRVAIEGNNPRPHAAG